MVVRWLQQFGPLHPCARQEDGERGGFSNLCLLLLFFFRKVKAFSEQYLIPPTQQTSKSHFQELQFGQL